MTEMRETDAAAFQAFIAAYPRPLERDVYGACEPALVTYNDFGRAPYWPDSVVASCSLGGGDYRVIADPDAPVEDDGERDTDEPLLDSAGVQLFEGDQVEAEWGSGPPNSIMFGRSYDADGRCIVRETILIRDKGTKYEHWSFESCHNIVRGFSMTKVA